MLENLAPTRVVLIDDSRIFRAGVRAALEAWPEKIRIVGEADTGQAGIIVCQREKPAVVVLDVCLPDRSGFQVCRDILAAAPSTQVLLLSAFRTSLTVYEAVAAGSSGFLLKEIDPTRLMESIVNAARNGADHGFFAIPPTTEIHAPPGSCEAKILALSSRQRGVLDLMAEGRTNNHIAKALGLEPSSVRYEVSVILKTLEVSRRAKAAAMIAGVESA